jgi:hypothetical protein
MHAVKAQRMKAVITIHAGAPLLFAGIEIIKFLYSDGYEGNPRKPIANIACTNTEIKRKSHR